MKRNISFILLAVLLSFVSKTEAQCWWSPYAPFSVPIYTVPQWCGSSSLGISPGCSPEMNFNVAILNPYDCTSNDGYITFCISGSCAITTYANLKLYKQPDLITPISGGCAGAGTYRLTFDEWYGTYYVHHWFEFCLTAPCEHLAGNPSVSCSGTGFTLSSSPSGGVPGYTYHWNTIPSSSASSVTVSSPGLYILTVTDSEGRTDTDSITVYPEIPLDLGPDMSVPATSYLLEADTAFAAYHWSTGDTTTSIVVLVSGTYYLTVTTLNGCVQTDSIFIDVLTSVPGAFHAVSGDMVTVSPNPANDQLLISTASKEVSFSRFSIVDLSGRVILSRELKGEGNSIKINVTDFPEGIYFVHTETDHGNQVKKFLISR